MRGLYLSLAPPLSAPQERLGSLTALDVAKADSATVESARKSLTELKMDVDTATTSIHVKAGVRASIAEQDKVFLKRIRELAASETDRVATAIVAQASEAAKAGDRYIVVELESGVDAKSMQSLVQKVIKETGVAVLAISATDDKVACLAAVPKDSTEALPANAWLQHVLTAVSGRGGGKPGQAQGSGPDVAGVPKALDLAKEMASEAFA